MHPPCRFDRMSSTFTGLHPFTHNDVPMLDAYHPPIHQTVHLLNHSPTMMYLCCLHITYPFTNPRIYSLIHSQWRTYTAYIPRTHLPIYAFTHSLTMMYIYWIHMYFPTYLPHIQTLSSPPTNSHIDSACSALVFTANIAALQIRVKCTEPF